MQTDRDRLRPQRPGIAGEGRFGERDWNHQTVSSTQDFTANGNDAIQTAKTRTAIPERLAVRLPGSGLGQIPRGDFSQTA
jgi:hypothetical protein